MKSIIISAPLNHTLHRCVAQKGRFLIVPPMPLNTKKMKIWNGESFDLPDFSLPIKDVLKAGVIFIVPDRNHA